MNVKIQLYSMLVSFLYGIIVCMFNKLNNKYINIKNKFLYYLINIIYIYIVVVFYIIIIYKINKGIFHIYFLIFIILGYMFTQKHVKFINNLILGFISKRK